MQLTIYCSPIICGYSLSPISTIQDLSSLVVTARCFCAFTSNHPSTPPPLPDLATQRNLVNYNRNSWKPKLHAATSTCTCTCTARTLAPAHDIGTCRNSTPRPVNHSPIHRYLLILIPNRLSAKFWRWPSSNNVHPNSRFRLTAVTTASTHCLTL